MVSTHIAAKRGMVRGRRYASEAVYEALCIFASMSRTTGDISSLLMTALEVRYAYPCPGSFYANNGGSRNVWLSKCDRYSYMDFFIWKRNPVVHAHASGPRFLIQ